MKLIVVKMYYVALTFLWSKGYFNVSRAENYTSETNLDRSEKSKMLRDRGNKSYSKKEMHAALAFYSQAIVAAPVNSRETALAIGTFFYSVLFTLNLYFTVSVSHYIRPIYLYCIYR